MKTRNMILSGAIFALVMLVTLNVPTVLGVGVGTGTTPSSALTVFTIKKTALICDQGASAPPFQSPPEIGGCVDVFNPDVGLNGTSNVTDYRFNEYLFTGEVLAELVVARDLDGAGALSSTATLQLNGTDKVTCSDVTGAHFEIGTNKWYGHDVSGLLSILPPRQGASDSTGFNASFDKVYQCLYTVTGVSSTASVTVKVTDSEAKAASTNAQVWYFNPAISINVYFDSVASIVFPPAQAGQTVYSTNTLLINNRAAGGVDLAVYLVGNDLTASGPVNCPTSNVLNINNMAYRCKVGTYVSEKFTPLSHLKEANGCHDLVRAACGKAIRQCDVEDAWLPGSGQPNTCTNNDLLPDASSAFTSLLYNGHTAECTFQLNVPFPCVGTYSNTVNAVEVLVRAI